MADKSKELKTPAIAKCRQAIRSLGWEHPHLIMIHDWCAYKEVTRAGHKISVDEHGWIYIQAPWVMALPIKELAGCIVHEIMHPVLQYFERGAALGIFERDSKGAWRIVPGREQDAGVLNVAQDWVINYGVRGDKIPLPEWVVYPDPEYTGALQTEPIYHWLKAKERAEQPPPPPPEQDQSAGGDDQDDDQADSDDQGQGEGSDGQDTGEGQDQASDQGQGQADGQAQGDAGEGQGQGQGEGAPMGGDAQPGNGCGMAPGVGEQGSTQDGPSGPKPAWGRIAAEAREYAARMPGSGHSTMLEILTPYETTIDWLNVLKRGVQLGQIRPGNDMPTYSRASRRPALGSFIRPGWFGGTPSISVVVDCSSSMAREWVGQIVDAVLSLARAFNVRVYLVTHTDQVCWAGWVTEQDRESVIEACSFGGGTNPAPAFQAVADEGTRFEALVHFTDCELPGGAWPECPARNLVIGAYGSGATGEPYTPFPDGAEVIPCHVPAGWDQ